MSDVIDDAAIEHEAYIKAALTVRQPTLPFIGKCHYCKATVSTNQHFCDADCRHDYERLKANGRV